MLAKHEVEITAEKVIANLKGMKLKKIKTGL
jgi:hypothetical protein